MEVKLKNNQFPAMYLECPLLYWYPESLTTCLARGKSSSLLISSGGRW